MQCNDRGFLYTTTLSALIVRSALGTIHCPDCVNVTHWVSVSWPDHLSCGHRLKSIIQSPLTYSLLPEGLQESKMTRSDAYLLLGLCINPVY